MAAAMAYSPLNSGYSPLNAVTAALPLNVLAGDLIPWLEYACMKQNPKQDLCEKKYFV